ncbi:MAG: hypothetical protein ABIJ40_03545 [Bacteroidota bacterium]
MNEINDILNCIAKFDKSASLEIKGRYFETIQRDIERLKLAGQKENESAYDFLTKKNNGKTPDELVKDAEHLSATWVVMLIDEYVERLKDAWEKEQLFCGTCGGLLIKQNDRQYCKKCRKYL